MVIHGTDTMAFAASVLSFMLENLQKPVILTGAQVIRLGGTEQTWTSPGCCPGTCVQHHSCCVIPVRVSLDT